MGKVQTQGLRRVTCQGSVRRDISVLHRGPQEARGKLLPFSCMQEKQLIIRVSSEKEGSRGRRSLMFSRSNSYDHHEGALLSLCLYRSIMGCAAWWMYIRASLHLWNVCLFLIIRGHASGLNKRSKSVFWHLCAADGPLEMAGAVGHFLECFELLQMHVKHVTGAGSSVYYIITPSPTAPWAHRAKPDQSHSQKEADLGLVSPDDSANVETGASGYFIQVLWRKYLCKL